MNNKWKSKRLSKLITVLLVLAMVMSALPAFAIAEEYDSSKQQVHVVVRNDNYSTSEGAEWEDKLVDTYVTIDNTSTMLSCIQKALAEEGYTASVSDSGYISAINGLEAGSPESLSGWMILQNDWFIHEASSEFSVADGNLKSGDEIIVAFSNDMGVDLGGSYDNNEKTVSSLIFSAGTLSPSFSSDVKTYTLTLDSSVSKVKVTPTATNKNFLVKTYLGTQAEGTECARIADVSVTNGSVITVVCGDPAWPTMNQASDVAKETYTVNVVVNEAENNVPNVKDGAITTATATAGTKFTLDLSTIFEDKDGDTLTYTVSVNGANAVSADKNYEYTPDAEGSVTLKFTANDGKASAEHTITLSVDKANNPPYVKNGAATTATVSLKYAYNPTLSAFFADADGDKLTYTVSVNGAEPVAANNFYRYTTTQLGEMTFTFTASDGKSSVSHTVTVTVVNDAPTVKSGAATTGVNKLGEEFTLDLSKVFTDKNSDTLTYKVSVDGADYVDTDSTYKITPASTGNTVLKFKANDGLADSPEHTFTLSTFDSSVVTIKTTPNDAIVRIYEGTTQILPNEDGEYSVNFGYASYTYEIVKEGYIGKSGDITEAGELVVELEQCNETTFDSVDAYWPTFRGNDSNMAIVSTKLPTTKAETRLAWNKKLGTSWADAPSVQIIADDSLVMMCNKKIYKLSLEDGSVIASADMVAAPNWGYTGPTYAEGLIICPLTNGTIQAFNAKTLESVWVYYDTLKGQSITPITYSDGYIYTGFYTGTTDGNFVCISLADEDPTSTNETKLATWKIANKGGYYWSGSAIVGDYAVFGSEQDANGNGHLYAVNKYTGNVIDSLEVTNNIRSTIAYDASAGKIYFTTQGSKLYNVEINKETGKLSNVKSTDIENASVSTPVVYKGRIYVYTDAKFFVVNESTMEVIFSVTGTGIAKASPILSTAYEDEGYLYFYNTYNTSPGGIRMVKVKTDASSADDAEVIDIYDATGFRQYCICSLICDENGTIYYKNDSLNILAVKANTPPSVTDSTATEAKINLGDKFALDLSALFEDKDGDTLTYTVSVDGADANTTSKNYELTPNKAGNITLKFTASDGIASTEHIITLSVNNIPNVKNGAKTTDEITFGNEYLLDLTTIFEDKDNDELTYTVSVDGAEAKATSKDYKLTPDKIGSVTLKFTATDGMASIDHTITLSVYTAPNVKEGAITTAEVDQYDNYTLDLTTIFEDKDGDTLTYTVSVNGAEAKTTSKDYKLTPDTAGIVTLKFTATDGKNSAEHTVTLTVNAVYIITSGNNSTWVIDSSKNVVITCDGPFAEFVGLKIDGEFIDEEDYTAVEGSTVVTLAPEYLATLSKGKHSITFVYESQSVEGSFTVKANTPKTGDNVDTLAFAGIALVMATASLVAINKRRKHN